jgi:regulator of replication initiation timing
MSAELRQLQEWCNAFDSLADALRTPDSWLSYRAEALRDQLQECERQDAPRPSTLERVCTALIDWDEALQQARSDLERMRTLASNWEAEVTTVRVDNQEVRAWLREAQAQQSQAKERARAAEQKAKEADELKAALDAKVAGLATAEDQLQQERTARQGAEGQLQQERPLLPTPGRRSSGSVPLARRRRRRWRSGTSSSRSSRASWWFSASRARARSSPSRSRATPSSACSRRSRPSAAPSRWRGSRLKVGHCFVSCFADLPLEGPPPFLISFLLATFRPAHHAGARDRPGQGTASLLQLLRAEAAGAAFCGPQDLPGRGRGRGTGWKLTG